MLELDVSGTSSDFIPDEIGLSPGRYYARITNSDARTASGITADFSENPTTIQYSNEIFIIVEANEAASIIAPKLLTFCLLFYTMTCLILLLQEQFLILLKLC